MCFVLDIKFFRHICFGAFDDTKNLFNKFERFLLVSFSIYLRLAIWLI